jgi:hypothetical protein
MKTTKKKKELTYEGAAKFIGCTSRHVRRLLKRFNEKPIRRGHRTVRIPLAAAVRIKVQLASEI